MKTHNRKWQTVLVAASIGSALTAAAQPNYINDPAGQNMNRFRAGGRLLFNVEAEFFHNGSPSNPGPEPGVHAVDRNYDNGYVRVDDSGNVGEATWNWGFVDLPGEPPTVNGTTLELRSTSSPAAGTSNKETDDPQYGFEVGYGRVLTYWDAGERQGAFGIDASFNMTWLNIESRDSVSGTATTTIDEYDMSGLPIIPSAPYMGVSPTPGGPLPLLLPDSPFARTLVETPTVADEFGEIDGQFYGIKIGPFFEIPVSDSIAIVLRGGATIVRTDTEFKFRETLSPGGTISGEASDNEWLFGGYAEVEVNFAVAQNVNLFVGGGYQHVEDHEIEHAGKGVKLDLGKVITATAGVTFSF